MEHKTSIKSLTFATFLGVIIFVVSSTVGCGTSQRTASGKAVTDLAMASSHHAETQGAVAGQYVDTRDRHVYRTVRLGKFEWFAENLAYLPRVSPTPEQGGIWVYGYEGLDTTEAKRTPESGWLARSQRPGVAAGRGCAGNDVRCGGQHVLARDG